MLSGIVSPPRPQPLSCLPHDVTAYGRDATRHLLPVVWVGTPGWSESGPSLFFSPWHGGSGVLDRYGDSSGTALGTQSCQSGDVGCVPVARREPWTIWPQMGESTQAPQRCCRPSRHGCAAWTFPVTCCYAAHLKGEPQSPGSIGPSLIAIKR